MEALNWFFGIVTVIGTVLGSASLVYAHRTNKEKQLRDRQVQKTLAGLAGDIQRVQTNPLWADQHFVAIRDLALQAPQNAQVQDIIRHAFDGARDATAAERMLGNLLNDVLTVQRGLFGSEEIWHIASGNQTNPIGLPLQGQQTTQDPGARH